MQTFLPYPDFKRSMQALEYRRLGQQRREASMLVRRLCFEIVSAGGVVDTVRTDTFDYTKAKGWDNHPALNMWRGHEGALALYHDTSILVWKSRGYQNTMPFLSKPGKHKLPAWFGDERLHSSHRSNLLRKDPKWYSRYGWEDDPEAEYYWPSLDPEYQTL